MRKAEYCYKSSQIGLRMQRQRKQCLMDIQSETKPKGYFTLARVLAPVWNSPNSLRQITILKQASINSVWWSAACGWWENVEFVFPPIPTKPFPFLWN